MLLVLCIVVSAQVALAAFCLNVVNLLVLIRYAFVACYTPWFLVYSILVLQSSC